MPDPPVDADQDGFLSIADLNSPQNYGVIGDCNQDGQIEPGELMYYWDPLVTGPLCHGLLNNRDDDPLDPGTPDLPVISIVDDVIGANMISGMGLGIGSQFQQDGEDCAGVGAFHGTSVSSIIGAVGNNSFGIAGVSWDVRILPVRISNDIGEYELADLSLGLEYARLRGAQVDNLSLSFEAEVPNKTAHDYVLRDYELTFENYSSPTVLHVAAAGNRGIDCDSSTIVCAPAEIDKPYIIGVASTDQDDRKSGSNFGSTTIDVAAPGRGVPALYGPGNEIEYWDGTSFAAPHVTGVAALVMGADPEVFNRPLGVVGIVRHRILSNADQLPTLNGLVVDGRRLNALEAVHPSP